MDVLAAANRREAEGRPVYHLELGQPSARPPEQVNQAAVAAMAAGNTGYTEGLGLPALRQRIARHYGERFGLDIAPERVVATTGSSGGFLLAFLACFDAGDRVALPRPGYPAYRNILKALDLVPVDVPLGPDTHFHITPERLEEAWQRSGGFKGLLIASPNNPTGTVLAADDLARIAGFCRDKGVQLISDEIYHGITYAGPAATALAVDDDALVINSFSKYYCMTGWRVGWMVIPEAMVRTAECLSQNVFVCAPSPAQRAAVAALDCTAELDRQVAHYAESRRRLLAALQAGGITRIAPADGAFYLYTDIADLSRDSMAFCARLLEDTGIALTPGVDFDPVDGGHHVRLSYAGDTAMIAEAATVLEAWLKGQ
jgi:aspartate/methionine/tyrosine aminotransferase